MVGEHAYVGDTLSAAYDAMLRSENDHDIPEPSECTWFKAEEIGVRLATAAVPKKKGGAV
jgi:hypothetical protein